MRQAELWLMRRIRRMLVVLPLAGLTCISFPAWSSVSPPFGYFQRIDNPAFHPQNGSGFGGLHYLLLQSDDTFFVHATKITDNGMTESGMVYVYERTGDWALKQTIAQPQPQPGIVNRFGASIALKDDVLFISDPTASNGDRPAGSVYIFQRSEDAAWALGGAIHAPASSPDAVNLSPDYGSALAFQDNELFVGAQQASPQGITHAGTVYIYGPASESGKWELTQRLVASDLQLSARFGEVLAVQDDTIVVGAYGYPEGNRDAVGRAYLFRRDADSGQWQQTQEFEDPNDHSLDAFGSDVLIIDDFVLIASDGATINGEFAQGAVYVYQVEPVSGHYSLVQTLQAEDGDHGDFFGSDIAYCKPYLFVAAPFATTPDRGINFSATGRVYVWKQDAAGQWQQIEEIFDPVNVDFDMFGSRLSCSGSELLVGASGTSVKRIKFAGVVYSLRAGGDLVLQQHAERQSVAAGENLTYEFLVSNQDDEPATNVILTIKLVDIPPPEPQIQPASGNEAPGNDAPDSDFFGAVTFVSASGANCSAMDSVITCELDDIPPGIGRQSSVTVRLGRDAKDGMVNIAVARSDQQNVVTRRTRTATMVKITAPPSKPSMQSTNGGGGGASNLLTLLGLALSLPFIVRGRFLHP